MPVFKWCLLQKCKKNRLVWHFPLPKRIPDFQYFVFFFCEPGISVLINRSLRRTLILFALCAARKTIIRLYEKRYFN
jgi:hypothetical protein